MTEVKSKSNKNVVATLLISVVLVIGTGTVLAFQERQDEAHAQAADESSSQDPTQFKPNATIYRINFHAITINENHDTSLGTGEWKLFARVNDKVRLLETCPFLSREEPNEKLDCNDKMYNVKDGQVVNFPSLYTDVKIGKGGAITLLVDGIDTDGEAWEPPTIPQDVQTALRLAAATSVAVSGMPINPITAIEFLSEAITHGGQIVKWAASFDENDKLGKIHEMYRGPNYEKRITNHPSDKGDYVLQYSIKALSPQDASYSHAEDCKPPIAGFYCTK
jgi:hypothetical protein